MDSDALTLYKLMVLYMLGKVDFALTNSQISEFILGRSYTNYFSLQQAISDLSETELIRTEQIYNNSYYTLTAAGEETLSYFGHRIPEEIRREIDQFFLDQRYHLRNENEVTADYYEDHKDCYIVRCEIREKKELLAGVTLTVTDEAQAVTICDNWKKNHQSVYSFLIQNLMIRK
jgi:DNA-binding PadR family transcriptional regulator